MAELVTALLVKPGETPRTRKVSPVFDSMREIVGANAAELYPFAEPVAVVYNPDGEGKRLPLNILLKNGSGEAYAAIHGAFLLVGVERGEYVSLTGRQTRRFRETFSRRRVSSENPCASLESAVSAFKRRGQPVWS